MQGGGDLALASLLGFDSTVIALPCLLLQMLMLLLGCHDSSMGLSVRRDFLLH